MFSLAAPWPPRCCWLGLLSSRTRQLSALWPLPLESKEHVKFTLLMYRIHICTLLPQFRSYSPTLATWRRERQLTAPTASLLDATVVLGLLSFVNYMLLAGLLFMWQVGCGVRTGVWAKVGRAGTSVVQLPFMWQVCFGGSGGKDGGVG